MNLATGVAEISFSRERSRSGRQSLRMRMPTRLEVPRAEKMAEGGGSGGVRRQFDGEDWRQFNRLSLWIYPDCPGFQVVEVELRLSNDGGGEAARVFWNRREKTTQVLRNHEWKPRTLGDRKPATRQKSRAWKSPA